MVHPNQTGMETAAALMQIATNILRNGSMVKREVRRTLILDLSFLERAKLFMMAAALKCQLRRLCQSGPVYLDFATLLAGGGDPRNLD
jgi:hypothetical protein